MKNHFLLSLSIFLSLIVSAQTRGAVDASNKIFVFRGKIQAVDAAAKTLTLDMDNRSYVFVVTDQTKIDLKQGQHAEVEMKIGPGGKGMAVLIQLGVTSREKQWPTAADFG